MSGIEKQCLLSLALDRVLKHGDCYLNEEIATPQMIRTILCLKNAISNIPDWGLFIKKESKWWIDLKKQIAHRVYSDSEILRCEKCSEHKVHRKVKFQKKDIFLCERCFKDWAKSFNKIMEESYNKNLSKWIEND